MLLQVMEFQLIALAAPFIANRAPTWVCASSSPPMSVSSPLSGSAAAAAAAPATAAAAAALQHGGVSFVTVHQI